MFTHKLEVVLYVDVIRSQTHRLFEMFDGLIEALVLRQGEPKIVVSLDIAGIDLKSVLPVCKGVLGTSELKQDDGQIAVRSHVIRLKA